MRAPDAFQRDPVNLIRIFHVAETKGVEVHPVALRTITRSLDLITDDVREDPKANRLFLEILTSRRDPERALRRLNEAGVLGRFVPPFAHAVALMQFNMYHHYTVDEHLIRAVGIVAQIERGELKADHPLATDLIKRIKSREILYCAILLHDMAKGLPGNHSHRRRRNRAKPLPASGTLAGRHRGRRVAGEKPSRDERYGTAP